MSKKNIKYLILIAVLLIANLGLMFTNGSKRSSSFDDGLFTVSNTESIQKVSIENSNGEIVLERSGDNWYLNEQFQVDPSFQEILFSLLNQIKVKREVGSLSDKSGSISIEFSDNSMLEFDYASDGIGTKSFFIKDGVGYQVEVPGYRDNVINIFELTQDQWRNRVVFDGSWRTIQRLKLTSKSDVLDIKFNNQFFEVGGVTAIDSSMVVDYLNQFQIFQANEMISAGKFEDLDSLITTDPVAQIVIDDIQYEAPITFSIFPRLPNQAFHLVTKGEADMMVFEARRIESLLKKSDEFEAK